MFQVEQFHPPQNRLIAVSKKIPESELSQSCSSGTIGAAIGAKGEVRHNVTTAMWKWEKNWNNIFEIVLHLHVFGTIIVKRSVLLLMDKNKI